MVTCDNLVKQINVENIAPVNSFVGFAVSLAKGALVVDDFLEGCQVVGGIAFATYRQIK